MTTRKPGVGSREPGVGSRLLAAGLIILLVTAAPAFAQKKKVKKGLVWDDRPSIVFSKNIHIDLRMKLQADWRQFDPEINRDLFDFRNLRFGVKGEFTRHLDFEVEREVTTTDWQWGDWKDVYVNWKTFDAVEVQGGRFKVPFGMEQLTGPTDTDFAYRSLGSSIIAPARDKGGMVHGRFWGRDLTYQAGVFNGDGDNGKLKSPQFVPPGEEEPAAGPSVAARVTATVLRKLPVPKKMKSIRLGVAYTNGELPEGLNSLKGESVFGKKYFDNVYVKGRRQRLGTEFEWTPGPIGVKAEWMQAREDRLQQGNRNEDLSDFLSTGWYASGTWLLTGEKKDDHINPHKPLFRGGAGAIEIGGRYDELGFGSASQAGPAYTNPRADHQVRNSDRVWTFGLNWFPNRWVKVVANGIHETFEDPKRTPKAGYTSFWTALLRTQLVF
jgi:phosphate-selective porin OprO/OprP